MGKEAVWKARGWLLLFIHLYSLLPFTCAHFCHLLLAISIFRSLVFISSISCHSLYTEWLPRSVWNAELGRLKSVQRRPDHNAIVWIMCAGVSVFIWPKLRIRLIFGCDFVRGASHEALLVFCMFPFVCGPLVSSFVCCCFGTCPPHEPLRKAASLGPL